MWDRFCNSRSLFDEKMTNRRKMFIKSIFTGKYGNAAVCTLMSVILYRNTMFRDLNGLKNETQLQTDIWKWFTCHLAVQWHEMITFFASVFFGCICNGLFCQNDIWNTAAPPNITSLGAPEPHTTWARCCEVKYFCRQERKNRGNQKIWKIRRQNKGTALQIMQPCVHINIEEYLMKRMF